MLARTSVMNGRIKRGVARSGGRFVLQQKTRLSRTSVCTMRSHTMIFSDPRGSRRPGFVELVVRNATRTETKGRKLLLQCTVE